jgi:peptide/nickel transport system permease protein
LINKLNENTNRKPPRARLRLVTGSFLILLVTCVALFAPWIAVQNPQLIELENHHQPPSWAHPFGCDEVGADVFSQVVYGARVSLTVGFTVVSVCLFMGLLIGSAAGYAGGWVDQIWMRLIDLLHAFPGFLLALSLVAVLGPSVRNLIIAMCLTGWTGYARLIRGEILRLKTRDYVQSAIALGATPWRIIIHHLWPQLTGILIVQATFGLAGAILTESGLSFLGLGAPADVATWGSLLNSGRRSLLEAPHISLFAGLAIATVVLGFNLLGQALHQRLDPVGYRH